MIVHNKRISRLTLLLTIILCFITLCACRGATSSKYTNEAPSSKSDMEIPPTNSDMEIVPTKEDEEPQSNASALYSPTMDDICAKLLDAPTDGIITLSDDEMTVLRDFMKQSLPDRSDDWWTLYPIRGKLLSTNGYCKYNNYIFFICSNRRVLFLDETTENTVGINNRLDYPMQYVENPDEYCHGIPYGLYYSSNSSYVLIKKQQGLEVKAWEFGENIYTWHGSNPNSNITADEPPTVIVWNEDYHFFIVDGNLLCIQNDNNAIKLLATDVSYDNVTTVKWAENTLYYSCFNELHMVNMTTLEDVKLAEDVFSGPSEVAKPDAPYNNSDIFYGAYAMYHNTSSDDCLVSGYFDENNQPVISESKVNAKIKEYSDYVEEQIKELSENVW